MYMPVLIRVCACVVCMRPVVTPSRGTGAPSFRHALAVSGAAMKEKMVEDLCFTIVYGEVSVCGCVFVCVCV